MTEHKRPSNFKELIDYMSANNDGIKATVVLLDESGDIMVASSKALDEDQTVQLLTDSALLVAGREPRTTIH